MVSQGAEPGASGTISVTAAGGWLSFFDATVTGKVRKTDDGKPEHVVDPFPAHDLAAGLLVVLPISGITFGFWPDDPSDGGMANEMGKVVMQATASRRRREDLRHTEMLDPLSIGRAARATSLS